MARRLRYECDERTSNEFARSIVCIYKADEGMLVTCTIPRQTEIKDGLIRLLIVDDQPFVRESLRTLLDRYEDLNVVGLAEDGNEAIDLCGRLQPHVILMDLDMQHMDGVEATKRLSNNGHISAY